MGKAIERDVADTNQRFYYKYMNKKEEPPVSIKELKKSKVIPLSPRKETLKVNLVRQNRLKPHKIVFKSTINKQRNATSERL